MAIIIGAEGGGGGGGGASEFTGLTDTPASYSGEADKVVVVNSGETGLEFVDSVSGVFPVEVFTGTLKNLVVADNLKFFVMDNVAAQVVALTLNTVQAFPIGAEMEFLRENATGVVSFVAPPGVELRSRDALVMINAQYSAAILKQIDIDVWRLVGDLA